MKRLESYDTKRGLSSAGDNCTGCGWKWLRSRVPERRRGGRALASKKLGPQTPASPHPGNYSFPTTWGPTSGLVWMNIPCSLSMCWMLHMALGNKGDLAGSFRYSLISSSQQAKKCLELIYLISAFKEKLPPYIWDRVLLCSPDWSQNSWLSCLLYHT